LVLGFGLDMFWPAPFLPEGWGFPLGLIVIFAGVNMLRTAAAALVSAYVAACRGTGRQMV
jgi:hypothetical protein